MRDVLRTAIALGLVLTLCGDAWAKRLALVVGQEDYAHLTDLKKTLGDARAIGAALKSLNFEVVTVREDLTYKKFIDELDKFEAQIERGDEVVVFFSGHGVAVGGRNYLLPIDTEVEGVQASKLRRSAVEAGDMVRALKAREPRYVFAILDACRNNPFETLGRSIGLSKGLARMEAEAGEFILFAAGPGQEALDRLNETEAVKTSVFTRVFLEHLKTPGLTIQDIAFETKVGVRKLAKTIGRDQFPEPFDQLTEKPVLLPRVVAAEDEARRKFEDDLRRRAEEETNRRIAALQEEVERLRHAGPQVAVLPPVVPPPVRWNAPIGCDENLLLVSFGGREPARCMTPGAGKTESFRDCEDKTCPEMVVVPSGTFQMGSPENEPERESDEGPRHSVTIPRAFAVGKYEVSFDEWDACVKDGGCGGYKPDDDKWGRGRLPVINVSWDQAQSYVAWISKKTGRQYRLLSEAEWEYAARAGTQTPFWWGKTITTKQANYDGNYVYDNGTKGEYRKKTMPVNTLEANSWGLFHVHGNVWEWVEDCYADNYSSKPDDLKKTGAPFKTESCTLRVVRGGSWSSYPWYLRSANRSRYEPEYSYGYLGFRLARTL